MGFNNYDIITRLVERVLSMGETSIGLWTGPQEFSCEMDCVRAFRDAYAQAGVPCPEMAIFSLPTNKELLFRHATALFSSAEHPGHPKLIIASSKLIADAIIEAAYYQNIILNQNISIISLGEGKWSNVEQLYCNVRASNIGNTEPSENSQGKGGDLRSKYYPTLTVVRKT